MAGVGISVAVDRSPERQHLLTVYHACCHRLARLEASRSPADPLVNALVDIRARLEAELIALDQGAADEAPLDAGAYSSLGPEHKT
jgi:hypothetical protein